jgi:mRNA interferase YafQ
MLSIHITTAYKKSFKKYQFSGKFPLDKLTKVLQILMEEKTLPVIYKDHSLKGVLSGNRECHITPNILLIYKIEGPNLQLIDLGSHSDLF